MGALRLRGRLVLVGLMDGLDARLALAVVLRRRLSLIGTVLRARPLEEKIAVARAFEDQLAPLFGGPTPALVPVVDRVLPWEEVADGHRALEANATFGKIVLQHVG